MSDSLSRLNHICRSIMLSKSSGHFDGLANAIDQLCDYCVANEDNRDIDGLSQVILLLLALMPQDDKIFFPGNMEEAGETSAAKCLQFLNDAGELIPDGEDSDASRAIQALDYYLDLYSRYDNRGGLVRILDCALSDLVRGQAIYKRKRDQSLN